MIRRHDHAAKWALMHIQPQPMSNGVHVPLIRIWLVHNCRVAMRFKEFAGLLLVSAEALPSFQLLNQIKVDFVNLFVCLENFICCVTERPGTREIIKVTPALLTGEDIKNDRLSQRDHI